MASFFAPSTIVGVLPTDDYIYAIEIANGRNEEFRFLRRARVPAPKGVYSSGVITDVELMGHSFRELWRSAGFTSKRVVLGLPAPLCTWRRMHVPPVSHQEQMLLLKNELENEGLADGQNIVMDFISLSMPSAEEGAPVVVVTADEEKVYAFREALHHAGLVLDAAEPLPVSAMRLATMAVGKEDVCLVALVAAGVAELTILSGGAARYQRRILGEWQPQAQAGISAGASAGPQEGDFIGSDRDDHVWGLLTDLRRSLVFSHRLAPQLPDPESVLLLTDEPDLDGFVTVTASASFDIPCRLLQSLVLPRLPVMVQEQLAGRGVSGYLLALGLALRHNPGLCDGVRLDLSKTDEHLLLMRSGGEIRLRAAVVGAVGLVVNLVLFMGTRQVLGLREQELAQRKEMATKALEAGNPAKQGLKILDDAQADGNVLDVRPELWLNLLESLSSPDVQINNLELARDSMSLVALMARKEAVPGFASRLAERVPLQNALPTIGDGQQGRTSFTLSARTLKPVLPLPEKATSAASR